MARKTTRKTNGSSRTSRTASSTNPAIQSAIEAGEVLRKRFETRLDDVRSRLQTFEKDWSKTDLRTRLDKVTRELNANDILARVKKTPAFKVVKNSDLLDRVQDFDYEKTVAQLRKDVKGVQEEVLDFFQTSASRLKNVIDLPSRADFERLNKKIDHLSTQVRTLESRKSRRN